jgi:tRNA pseudouridine38-40 synthase
MKYKITVAYDGTDFHGWQIQPRDITVASTLQKAFETAFEKSVSIVGASRTDAGVHALGQVAVCKTELDISIERLMHAWNNSLPNSIVIRSLQEADEEFHIFTDVTSKTYYYHLFLKRPLPFVARYGWFWKFIDSVDWEKFNKSMNCFVGEHDFRSFCKCEDDEEDCRTTVRRIDSIVMKKVERFGALRIEIKSKGFLRYQIRRMIGAALDVSRKRDMSVDFIKHQLDNPSDQQEFVRAEGSGLCLRKIIYGKTYE